MGNAKKRGRPFTAERQPPASAKRVKKKKTRIIEAVGLDSWESIQDYLLTKGAKKFIDSINKLQDKSYVFSYLQAMEYFKPKLSRAEVTGKDGQDLTVTFTETVISKKV
jgi:N-methylhydantoinase B/oxoprolinase/acetone carboxylase alpha subunit